MAKWPWIERAFHFDYPPTKWPDLLERVRGTPARLDELLRGLEPRTLTYRDGNGWSILENVGHLLDLESLVRARIDEILAGASVVTAADMTNRKTHEAGHNETPVRALQRLFRSSRARTVAKFEQLEEPDWGKAAFHERLQTPLRIVDVACMTGEHDDYHLARMRALIRAWASPSTIGRS
jgi:hypothetical protein